jgi:hypothetical protein
LIICTAVAYTTDIFLREKIRATKIRTSKIKRTLKIHQSMTALKVSIKVIRTSKIEKITTTTTTYGKLPMDTKACGGLG